MRDIMIDLETLGQTPGCIPLSIGAVQFGPTGLGAEFYTVVTTADAKKAGLFTEPSTIEWWDKQAPSARLVLQQAASPKTSVPLRTALDQLTAFLGTCGSPSTLRIHGNGADFDNAILACAYRAALREVPWRFWHNRCHRTNKAKAPKSAEPPRQGTYHNALDDAKHQARHAIELSRVYGVSVFC